MNELRLMIRNEIHAIAAEIRLLKKWWRTRPDRRDPAPPATRFDLRRSKNRATLLCMLIAHSRRRLHLGRLAGLEAQAALLGEELGKLTDGALREVGQRFMNACVAPTEERRA